LIGETDIRGETREVVLSACKSLERGSHTKSHAMAGDRVAGHHTEGAAEVMGRDRQRVCEARQRAAGLRGQQLASAVDEKPAGAGRRRPSGGNAVWIDLFERRAGERDRSLDELVGIGGFGDCGEQYPVGEVESRRNR
jgi:hypothetical protein